MPELVFFRRGEEVLRVGLERQHLVLGRGEDSDVVIPDPHHTSGCWLSTSCGPTRRKTSR